MYTRQVTPTAKRNSVRVAMLVGCLPRVACFARNPGLGKRNSVRVAWDAFSPRWVKYVDAREPVSPSSRVWSRQHALFKPSPMECVPPNCLKHNKKGLSPLGRALKNYRYFHFIGVFRRHYRAFTRRSGYDVW